MNWICNFVANIDLVNLKSRLHILSGTDANVDNIHGLPRSNE